MTRRRISLAIAALGILPLVANGEESLGRLFFTAEQRQALDRERALGGEKRAIVAPSLTVNGVVTRETGKNTLWINGIAQHDNEDPPGVIAAATVADSATVKLSATGNATAQVRVETSLNSETKQTTDLLGHGRLQVNSPSPAAR